MTRQERIAALEAQLANSRKRRSELGQSLGLDREVGNAGAVALQNLQGEIYENGTSRSVPPTVCTPANVLSNFLPAVLSSPRLLYLFAYLRQ